MEKEQHQDIGETEVTKQLSPAGTPEVRLLAIPASRR